MTASVTRAFAIGFTGLDQWDVRSAWLRLATECHHPLVALGDLCTVRYEVVSPADLQSGKVRMLDRVSFGGEVFAGTRTATKMTQYLACRGDIVVSKIRARQGSVGLLDDSVGPTSVTIHYRVLTPDRDRVDPLFLWHSLRSSFGRNQFLAATGGAMKGEISETQLLRVKVPLPSVATQQAILSEWQKAQQAIVKAEENARRVEAEIEVAFLAELGMKASEREDAPRMFAVSWSSLERWSVEYMMRVLAGFSGSSDIYPAESLRELCNGVSGCTPRTTNSHYWNGEIPWVSPKDMKTDVVTDTKDHITDLAVREAGSPVLPPDAVLVVMRSGILQRMVPVALLSVSASINQDMRAFLVRDRKILLPEFLAAFLRFRQKELLRLVKWSTTVQSLNKTELDQFPIPLPPLDVQRRIIEKVAIGRSRIAREREKARALRSRIEADMESYLLGSKKVGNL